MVKWAVCTKNLKLQVDMEGKDFLCPPFFFIPPINPTFLATAINQLFSLFPSEKHLATYTYHGMKSATYPNATLADLYDPDLMPVDLRRAHRNLDDAVDKLHRRSPFSSDREWIEHLFSLYEKVMAPSAANVSLQL